MAVDEAMAMEATQGVTTPTLRVFAWAPPCISLGYHQRAEEIDVERCLADGIGLVRRPTGGRAILHDEELTYSVVIPAGSPWFGEEVAQTYELISLALVEGLHSLGVAARFERAQQTQVDYRRAEFSVPCFSSSVRNEVLWQGRKLVGSAQRRYEGALLQHGSILLGSAHLCLVDYLAGLDEEKRARYREYLRQRTAAVSEIAGRTVSFAEMAAALAKGFARVFGVSLCSGQLTEREKARARELLAKYQDPTRR
ncbi:MAG: biotin/lipoate A/B protein ligase family protein [bacterium]|jgi:lipoate-protein ligase A|nr:lipoate--protein ligase family protein [candidate division KSB1 bacterium]MDH7559836.1 biotin/lipoate A/B protein ligase family protein [bacterium]